MQKLINILLVEDDQLDIIDVKRTFEKMALLYNLEVARNGEEALAMLDTAIKNAASLPDVIIIDINMPKMDGFELLAAIRSREALRHLKCFILTTSAENEDRQKAAQWGISGYLMKPLKLNSPASMDAFNLKIDLMNF